MQQARPRPPTKKTIRHTFAARLTEAMKANGLVAHGLSVKAEVSANAVRGHLSASQAPNLTVLHSYAAALGVSVGWLAGEDAVRGVS